MTERWNAYAMIRQDLFGFIDMIVLIPSREVLCGVIIAVQATSTPNVAARKTKILNEPRARNWIEAGGCIEVWGWAKRGKAGKRKLWTLTRKPMFPRDFAECAAAQVGASA